MNTQQLEIPCRTLIPASLFKFREIQILLYLFLLFTGIAILKSMGFQQNSNFKLLGEHTEPLITGLFILLLIGPVIWITANSARAAYFFGASPALGLFPSVSHLPFLQEVSHLMVLVAVITHWHANEFASFKRIYIDKRLFFYFLFLGIAAFSVGINYILYASLWQLKVGVSNLIIFGCLGLYFVSLQISPNRNDLLNEMLKGFLHSSFFACLLGGIAVVLLFVISYSDGTNQIGNNTIFGLGYFDRMQLLFPGPTFAGIFFVLAIAVAIYVGSRPEYVNSKSRFLILFFLQFAPWLIMASGSRPGRIGLVIVLLTCLINQQLRKLALLALPSSLIALAIGAQFQSLPSAAKYFLGHYFPQIWNPEQFKLLSIQGRFFKDPERVMLVQNTVQVISKSPIPSYIFGNGLGVTGYSSSGFPTPHQQPLALFVETGFLGACVYYLFLFQLALRIVAEKYRNVAYPNFPYILLACFLSLMIVSVGYNIGINGITLFLFALMFVLPANQENHFLRDSSPTTN